MAKRSIPTLSFVLETMLPDGPHWYEGHKRITASNGAVIEGPQWTPYWEDAYKYDDTRHANAELDANNELEKISGSVKGAYVCATEDALWKDAWIQIDELHYMIRAKYMQVGNKILMAGHSHPFEVIKKDDNYFSLKDDAGGILLMKRNSGKKVIVQTKPRKLY